MSTLATLAPAAVASADAGGILSLDPAFFRSQFARQAHLIQHRLVGHPLFELPRLMELARRLPAEHFEYNAGNIPISQDWQQTPRTGLSLEESIRRIEECCSWMFLKRVELDPEYRALLDQVLDELQVYSEDIDPGMYDRAAAIFISSPNAVTPYHMDQEHNYLLQIRGNKTIKVYPGQQVLTQEEFENHLTRTSYDRNLTFRPEYEALATTFELTPGHALYFPPLDPHYVQNGPGVSVSFSCAFFTPRSERRWGVHDVNRRLRRLGLTPAPYGQSAWRDAVKALAFRTGRRLGRLVGVRAEEEK